MRTTFEGPVTKEVTGQFRHQALFYSGGRELVARLLPFVSEGLQAGDKVLVALSTPKLDALRKALGPEANKLAFADMDSLGANPARIIPLWSGFTEGLAPGQRARGVGEPITAKRSPAELVECQIHESLLNVAFADGPPFVLLCPYDTGLLGEAVVEEARCSHAFVTSGSQPPVASQHFVGLEASGSLSGRDLPPAPPDAHLFRVDTSSVALARHLVRLRGEEFGLHQSEAWDFALAAHEVIANSLKHAGGGELSLWAEDASLICEVRDQGRFADPLAGRLRPEQASLTGRGLWMANQLCDLVQIRALSEGTVVRLHIRKHTAGR